MAAPPVGAVLEPPLLPPHPSPLPHWGRGSLKILQGSQFEKSNQAKEIQLVGDVNQFLPLDLSVALGHPGPEIGPGQFGVALQGLLDGMDDEMEKVSLIPGIAVRTGEDQPVGAARRQQRSSRGGQMREKPAAGAAAAGRPAVDAAFVHAAVI